MKIEKKLVWAIWGVIILVCFFNRDKITVNGIVTYVPENVWFAAVMMLALFALKSLSVVIHVGILYAINGILFSFPIAMLVNIAGTAVMMSLPYLIGKKTGDEAVDSILKKYPKAQKLREFRSDKDFLFAFIMRVIGGLPADVISMYMGAVGLKYGGYLLGSVLGSIPNMLIYSFMGVGVTDLHSPQFWTAVGIKIVYTGCIALFGIVYGKHKAQGNGIRERKK